MHEEKVPGVYGRCFFNPTGMTIMLYGVHSIIIFLLAWRWFKLNSSSLDKFFWPALAVKLSSGVVLGLIYSQYYVDSDTFSFFQESIRLADIGRADWVEYLRYLWFEKEQAFSGENRTLFFIKLVSLFSIITNNNYWIVSLYFSFFSFAAAWWLVQRMSTNFSAFRTSAVLAFLFFPSCVFWSTGIIKESVAMTVLYGLTGLFLTLWQNNKITWLQIVIAIVCVWVLWSLKYYYAAIFLPVALSALLARWFVRQRMKPSAVTAYRELMLLVVLLMIFLFVVTFVHPNFYPHRILAVVVENYEAFYEKSDPDKMVQFNNLKPEIGSILRHTPWALISGLFRPFIWEASNVFQVVVSLENLLLLLLTFLALRNVRVMTASPDRLLLFSVLLYCIMLCVFLTLSAPNFGTYVRYRVGFFPFFIMLVMYNSPLAQWFAKLFRIN